jgi:hypothetical protein
MSTDDNLRAVSDPESRGPGILLTGLGALTASGRTWKFGRKRTWMGTLVLN